MLRRFKHLHELGVLGLNQRNIEYINRYNKRKYFPIVDDKLNTKRLATEINIACPQLYGVIEANHDLANLATLLQPYQDFVIKPARGSGGGGILVIAERLAEQYRSVSNELLDINDLRFHISNILNGIYSLGGRPDKAIIEYFVKVDPIFEPICYKGVPDLRIITLLGYPTMAMVRLPTQQSRGKANLHQGAVGVGIEISSGKTLSGVWQNLIIKQHPDTMKPFSEVVIPHWHEVLNIAARCYELTKLGYLGVDIVLDKDLGPMMLEVNARPGLSIQIANKAGLIPRYEIVKQHSRNKVSVEDRVAFVMKTFHHTDML